MAQKSRWDGAGKKRIVVNVLLPPPPDSGQNSFGEPVGTNTVVGPRYVSFESGPGRELIQAQQVQADVTHVCRMRYGTDLAGIGPKWHVQMTDASARMFEIVYVVNVDERNREFLLWLKETV